MSMMRNYIAVTPEGEVIGRVRDTSSSFAFDKLSPGLSRRGYGDRPAVERQERPRLAGQDWIRIVRHSDTVVYTIRPEGEEDANR